MLTIRSAQLTALAEGGRDAEVAQLVQRVRTRYPQSHAWLGPEGVHDLVSELLQACQRQGRDMGQHSHIRYAIDSLFGQAARLQSGPDAALRSVLLELEARELISLLETATAGPSRPVVPSS